MSGIWFNISAHDPFGPHSISERCPFDSFRGAGATAFLEWLTPSSLGSLSDNSSTLSVLLLPNGGILDDTIITKHSPDQFYVVTNAGRRDEDLSWFSTKIKEWNDSHSD